MIGSEQECEAAGDCTWNTEPSDCEWTNDACVGTSANLAETASVLAALDMMQGSQCTPGEAGCGCTSGDIAALVTMDQENPDMSAVSSGCLGCMMGAGDDEWLPACMAGGPCTPGDDDCSCAVADLDYFMAAQGSDEEPDMSQLSSGCMSCLVAGGEDGAEECFGMGAGGCSPGTSGCVCDASDYASVELLVAAGMAADSSDGQDSSGLVLGGACVRCMSATGKT